MKKYIFIFITAAVILTMIISNYACSPSSAVRRIQPQPEVEISGAFGYRFGDLPDKSKIIRETKCNNPILFEAYQVQPKLKNRELDSYTVRICKRTKIINNIMGHKIFDSRDQAMELFQKVKPHIEQKYGPFTEPKYLKEDSYAETIINKTSSVSLIVTTVPKIEGTKWMFAMLYNNIALERQCESSSRPRW